MKLSVSPFLKFFLLPLFRGNYYLKLMFIITMQMFIFLLYILYRNNLWYYFACFQVFQE